MTKNDIFRRIRYIFDFSDQEVIDIFARAEQTVGRPEISSWLKREGVKGFAEIRDVDLATFLNGFVILKRGRREGPLPEPEKRLSNNDILKKLKVALSLRAEDVLDLFDDAGMPISAPELSSFLRNPKHGKFRELQDQYLRNFLIGLQKEHRDTQG